MSPKEGLRANVLCRIDMNFCLEGWERRLEVFALLFCRKICSRKDEQITQRETWKCRFMELSIKLDEKLEKLFVTMNNFSLSWSTIRCFEQLSLCWATIRCFEQISVVLCNYPLFWANIRCVALLFVAWTN